MYHIISYAGGRGTLSENRSLGGLQSPLMDCTGDVLGDCPGREFPETLGTYVGSTGVSGGPICDSALKI